MTAIPFHYNDGGRAAAGFKGEAGDCAVRAVAIAAELPYIQVYDRVFYLAKNAKGPSRTARSARKNPSPRNGAHTKIIKPYLEQEIGFDWVPTMGIGTGCTVHVRADELPSGRLVLALSRHFAAVVDGVLHDTYDCSRSGSRCVYGYWRLSSESRQVRS